MDRGYLEDYAQREWSEFERLEKRILEGNFSFEKDRYPPDKSFINLQKPVALASLETVKVSNIWAQIPFCGSLIILLPPFPQSVFEESISKISEIPKIIDFIKDTGRLQVAITEDPRDYEGLNYLDPFFKELNPPLYKSVPIAVFGTEKEIQMATDNFLTLGKVRFLDFWRKKAQEFSSRAFSVIIKMSVSTYINLELGHYTVVEDIENLMVDDPARALMMLNKCRDFIVTPITDMRSSLRNFALEEIRTAHDLPLVYQPEEIRFPCEIGKFLLEKLTYAPYGLDACKELMYHYDAYDLRKVAESLNEAIVTNHPDILNKSTEEFSEILDNIWNDSTIPRKVKGLEIGVPLSMAAIGSVAAGPIGAAGGFLAGLGFNVANKFIDVETTGLSEKLAKLRTKSYQVNVYDFKKKYKNKIVPK